MPKLTQTKRERVGTEIFEVEYEETTRTKVTGESLAYEIIFNHLSSPMTLDSDTLNVAELANELTRILKVSNLLK